jgi:hypothetical protein
MKIGTGIQAILSFRLRNLRGCNVGNTDGSFMKIGIGIQAILRFCLRNLRGCNVGITDGRDL